MTEQTLIKNGLVFDGRGSPAAQKHVLIRDGRVAKVSDSEIPIPADTKVIDAGSDQFPA